MTICDEGAITLVQMIVHRAVLDWRGAGKKLRKRPYFPDAVLHEEEVRDCERFFRSAYFERITGINGEAFLRMMRESA